MTSLSHKEVTEGEHKEHLKLLFKRLNEYSIVVNPAKCVFGVLEITFLGYTVSKDGIKPHADRVEAIREFPKPTIIREHRKFLDMVNFYRRFIPHAAKIMMPLKNLLKGNAPLKWNGTAEKVFEEIKEKLAKATLVAHPKLGACRGHDPGSTINNIINISSLTTWTLDAVPSRP